MKKIGIIINANAKKNRKMKKDPGAIYRDLGGSFVDVRLTGSLAELDQVLVDFKKKEIDYLGIAGGDGSLHHGLTHAIKVYGEGKLPPVIIFKGGTMDNVSRSLALKGKGPGILKRLIGEIEKGNAIRTVKRSTMKIEKSYCFLFGTGFVTNFLEEAYSGKEKGLMTNINVISKSIKQIIRDPENGSLFQGFKGNLYADGEQIQLKEVKAILAGTVEHIGMGFSPLYRSLEIEESFHAIVSGIPSRTFLRKLNKLKKGIPLNLPEHYDLVINELKIESEIPFTYTMDGDLYKAEKELLVRSGPLVELVVV